MFVRTPLAAQTPSERGATIRRQLAGMGYALRLPGEVYGTPVLLHRGKGRKEDLLPVAERFCSVAFRCLLPDLPAHGDSLSKSVHYGAGEQEDEFARRVLSEAMDPRGRSQEPGGIWGISMGGALAASALSATPSDWACAVIVSSFDSLDQVIRDESDSRAWFPGSVLSSALQSTLRQRHGLDLCSVVPVVWAGEAGVPVMVVHGTADALLSLNRGRALFNALRTRQKRWVEVEGGASRFPGRRFLPPGP